MNEELVRGNAKKEKNGLFSYKKRMYLLVF